MTGKYKLGTNTKSAMDLRQQMCSALDKHACGAGRGHEGAYSAFLAPGNTPPQGTAAAVQGKPYENDSDLGYWRKCDGVTNAWKQNGRLTEGRGGG
jgi:hypothetical protein